MGIGVSVFLIAVGAILAFAVTVNDATVGSITVDWNTVGVILMLVGAIGLIWSLVLFNSARSRRDVYVDDRPDQDRIAG